MTTGHETVDWRHPAESELRDGRVGESGEWINGCMDGGYGGMNGWMEGCFRVQILDTYRGGRWMLCWPVTQPPPLEVLRWTHPSCRGHRDKSNQATKQKAIRESCEPDGLSWLSGLVLNALKWIQRKTVLLRAVINPLNTGEHAGRVTVGVSWLIIYTHMQARKQPHKHTSLTRPTVLIRIDDTDRLCHSTSQAADARDFTHLIPAETHVYQDGKYRVDKQTHNQRNRK